MSWTGFGNYNEQMGTKVTPAEALQYSGLNFDVGRFPAYVKIGDEFVEVPHRNFTVRMDTDYVFDAVGPDYRVFQNKEGFEFLGNMMDTDGLIIETAIEFKGGAEVVVVARVPEEINLGDETFHKYMLFSNRHDGKGAFQAFGTDVCVVCQNTYQLAKSKAKDKFTISHTRNMEYKIAQAREAIKLSFKQTDKLADLANNLITEKFDKTEYNRFMYQLTGMDKIDPSKNPKAYSRANGIRTSIHEIHMDRVYIDNYRGTKWGVMQAVTDYTSNVKNYRNAHTRFADLVDGPNLNNKALDLLTA